MEKARFNPRYAGVHIWLRKDKDLKTSFKRRVNDEIYEYFSWMYESNHKVAYGEHNVMWLDWWSGTAIATGSFGPNTQPPEYVANQIPNNPHAKYGGTWYGVGANNSSYFYGRRFFSGGKFWYGFGWIWWNDWHHPGGAEVGASPHNETDKAMRFFEAVDTRGGLGPASYALWYVNGRPSTDLYDLFYTQFNQKTKDCLMTEIPDNWMGHK